MAARLRQGRNKPTGAGAMIWLASLAAFYVALTGTLSTGEMLGAAAAIVPAFLFALSQGRVACRPMTFVWSWDLYKKGVAPLPRETLRVGMAFLWPSQRVGDEVGAVVAERWPYLDWATQGHAPRQPARRFWRALAILSASLAPNRFVISSGSTAWRMRLHQLVRDK
jgi:hypothetical protein